MKTVLRSFAAIIAGLLVLFIGVIAVEFFSAVVHPFPENFAGTTEEICRHVERYPHWVLAVVVPAWALAALAALWTAGKIGNLFSTAIVALLLLAALIFNLSMLPYPTWFKVACLLVISIAAFAGYRLSMYPKITPSADGKKE